MPEEFVLEFDGVLQVLEVLDDAITLADIDRHLRKPGRVEMSILNEYQERKLMTWLESMRRIGDHLWLVFLEEAEEIRKPIMCFRIEQSREEPHVLKKVGQYVRPFQTTRPPKKTRNGKTRT